MRIFAQDRAFYRKVRVDLGDHPEVARRFELLQGVERARGHGLTLAAVLALLGLARSACCDWRGRFERDGMRGLAPRSSRPLTHRGKQWTPADARRVFAIREEMRWRGKARLPLEHNLRHPDKPLSLAAVGRIVRWGLESGRIKPCSFWRQGRAKAKRKRSFAGGHAERWRGEDRRRGVQVDHMTLSIDGKVFKEFGFAEPFGVRAVCPKTRRQHAQVFSRATSGVARAFLAEALERLGEEPIQVDGGLRVHGRVRGRVRQAKPAAQGPAAPTTAVERHRRAGQPNRPIRVLARLRRRTELRGHEQGFANLLGLLQQPSSALP